jgi:DNA-binding PadR family transcriptional regulator
VAGKTRKHYSLTKEGKKQLRHKEEEWMEYTRAVGNVLGGVCFG